MPSATNLAVVVSFHNMRREAPRTLYSLTPSYQQGGEDLLYEVVALDNGSAYPLREECVKRIGGDAFSYAYVETSSGSPAAAINDAARASDADLITCVIDGARILSPGILAHSVAASRCFRHPFVYTIGMHLGPKPQNESVLEGYDRDAEDALLETVDWRANGYALFVVSSVALSSKLGFFSELIESNCFTMRRHDFLRLGGLDEAFCAPGGGLVNLDLFNRVHDDPRMSPILLLGEATFHQFHGGAATNVPMIPAYAT